MIDKLDDLVGAALTFAQTDTLACLMLTSLGMLFFVLRVIYNRNRGQST